MRKVSNLYKSQENDLIKPIDPIILVDNFALTEPQRKVLQLPRKFAITPSKPPDNNNIKADIMKFTNSFRWNYLFSKNALDKNEELTSDSTFVKPPWWKPTERSPPHLSPIVDHAFQGLAEYLMDPSNMRKVFSNLTPELRKAIEEIKKFPQDYGVRIAECDKSEAYIIVPIEKDRELALKHLNSSHFDELQEDPSKHIFQLLKNWINKGLELGLVSQKEADFITAQLPKSGSIKLLYKSHKENFSIDNCKTRIITRVCGSTIENTSKWIQHYMSPLVEDLTYKLRDTKDTIKKIEKWNQDHQFNLPNDVYIIIFDITEYYPNVDTDEFHETSLSFLKKQYGEDLGRFIIEGSDLCVKNSVVGYEKRFYKQKNGVPAGLPHICALTDLGSDKLMENIVTSSPFEWLKDKEGKPCVGLFRDDGFGLVVGLKPEDLQNIQDWFNQIHDKLKFEVKICREAEFLDILISIENGVIVTKPYSKPSASHKYLSPNSCHDKKVINAIPYGVFYRLKLISSSDKIFEEAAAEYLQYLLDSGYSAQLINEKLNLIRALDRNCMMEDNKKKNEDKKGVLSALILDGHPAIPNGRKALKSANDILKLDKVANQMMLDKGRNISAVRRLPYLSELLGTGKDPPQLLAKQNTTGYFGC